MESESKRVIAMCLDGSMKDKGGSDAKWIQAGERETLEWELVKQRQNWQTTNAVLLSLC